MKLTTFLLFVGISCAFSSTTYSQGKVSIRLAGGTLPELFMQIKQQSGWRIFYNDDLISFNQKVTLDVKDRDVREVLDIALRDTRLTYRIVKKQIAIIARDEPDQPVKLVQEDSGYVIKGRVYDTHEPPQGIPGATVRVKDSNKGVLADADGYFTIRAKKNEVLQFAMMGYEPTEFTVLRGMDNLTISLKEKVDALDEVVVVGQSELQRKHIASAVSSLDVASRTSGKPITQLSQALQGGVTGIQVRQGSGLPGGDAATIKIRGVSTVTGSTDPLVLVDGVPMDMNFIDPLTVESVTVLKDAAAAAVYGARAGNGVILVTTRRGTPGRVAVMYDGYWGVQSPSSMPETVDAPTYMKMYNEAQVNAGRPLFYSQQDIDNTIAGTDPVKYPNTNWQDVVINKKAPITSHSLSVSGGNSMARFALTANYQYQDGMTPLTGSRKYNIRANTSVSLSKKFTVFMDMLAIKRNVTYPNRPNSADNTGNRILEDIYRVPPTIIPKYPTAEGKPDMYGRYVDIVNPLAYAEVGGTRKYESMQSSINLQPKWEVLPGLNLKGQFSYRLNSDMTRTSRDNYYFFDYYNGQLLQTWALQRSVTPGRTTYYYAGASADYTFDINKHHFFALLGYSQEETQAGDWDIYSMLGTYSKLNYSYADKYLVEAAFRMDGNSKFGPGHKYGYFPSIAVGWNMHKEPFMQSLRSISNLKIRASYGQLGNSGIPSYLYQNLISASDGLESTWGNPDISWEKVNMLDAGFDLGLYENKLEVTFDYYNKLTDGILLQPPVSYVGGLGTPPINAGKVRNVGVELAVNYNGQINKDWSISVRPGITYNKNSILSLKGGPYIKVGENRIDQEGGILNGVYGYEANGLLQASDFGADGKALVPIIAGQQPGDIRYVDQDTSGVIDGNDQKLIGNRTPAVDYFVNFRIGYKNFDLEWLIQGVSSNDILLAGMLAYPLDMSFDGGVPTKYYSENYWTPQRTDARFPRLSTTPAVNKLPSSFWFQNGAYTRLKFIQLGYNIHTTGLKRSGIQNIRVYANAQNPFVITGMKLTDPESQGNQWTYGIMKTYMIGCNVQF